MTKHIIKPGMELEVPSLMEIGKTVGAHFQEALAQRHIEFPLIKAQLQLDAAGNFNGYGTIAGNGAGIGPPDGFAWALKRLSIIPPSAAGTVTVGHNDSSSTAVIGLPTQNMPVAVFFSSEQVILRSTEHLYFIIAGGLANGVVSVAGQVAEVPNNLVGKFNF